MQSSKHNGHRDIEVELANQIDSAAERTHAQPPAAEGALATRLHIGEYLNGLGLEGSGAEIGVKAGFFSNHLLATWKGSRLYSIDPWSWEPGDNYVDKANVSQEEHEEFRELAESLLAQHAGRSRVLRLSSDRAYQVFAKESLDFVYLDARHDYQSVRSDILRWWSRIRRGGILAGHDYLDGHLPQGEFGVKMAVDEFAESVLAEVMVTQEDDWPSWLLRKTE